MGCWGLVVNAATAALCSGINARVQMSISRHFLTQFSPKWLVSGRITHLFFFFFFFKPAILQKYLDNFDLSIKVIYIMGTLCFAIGENTCNTYNEQQQYARISYIFHVSVHYFAFPTLGTVVMAIFPNVYVAMVMISTMGIISMSMSYCPYALLGQYHEIKEVLMQSENRVMNIDVQRCLEVWVTQLFRNTSQRFADLFIFFALQVQIWDLALHDGRWLNSLHNIRQI